MRDIVLKNVAKDYRTNEAYKSLRTNVEFSGADNKVIVMTSSTPNEGKSTVALGLAWALAEGGKRVRSLPAFQQGSPQGIVLPGSGQKIR